MTTHLASIRKIEEIVPIENATKVVRARITGDVWVVTGTMNNFAEGDLVVYFKPNTFVPDTTAGWLCNPDNPDIFNGVKGGTVRATVIRKHESNGLIMPTITEQYTIDNPLLGDDVSDQLGVKYWTT